MKFVEYRSPKEVSDIFGWILCGWSFYNRFGIREKGIRILGFSFSNFIEGEADFIKLTPEICRRIFNKRYNKPTKLNNMKEKIIDYLILGLFCIVAFILGNIVGELIVH